MSDGIDKILKEIQWVDIDIVKPYDKNPKVHTVEQIEKLAYTFEKFGFDVPIVVDADYVIIKGHARMKAAKKLKWKKVPIVIRSNLTPQQVRASRIADNQVAESYWDMPALMEELEALYGMDEPLLPLTDTGFSENEIRSMLPGLLETEDVEYKISPGTEGLLMGYMPRMQQDGKIGTPDPFFSKKDAMDILVSFDTAIIPSTGSAISIASAIKIRQLSSDIQLLIVHSNPGTNQFADTIPYLKHIAKELNAEFLDVSPKNDLEFRGRIPTQGYPSVSNLWCEIGIVIPSMENYLKTNNMLNKTTVMVLGATREQSVYFRRIGKFENSYYYFNPFLEFQDEDLLIFLEQNLPPHVGLHPMYKHLTSIQCPQCPLYKAPDFAFMKNNMLLTWIQNLEYFGYSKRNRSYRYSENFDKLLKDMIAESIDERAILPYSDLAMDSFQI